MYYLFIHTFLQKLFCVNLRSNIFNESYYYKKNFYELLKYVYFLIVNIGKEKLKKYLKYELF